MTDVTDVPVNQFTDVPVNKFTENPVNKFMENPVNKFTEIITDNKKYSGIFRTCRHMISYNGLRGGI